VTEATLVGEKIVCVGFADWEAELWTNQHHLMSRLARRNHVLFVESLGLRRPQLTPRDVQRMARRLRRTVGGVRPADGLHVVSPPVLPLHAHRAVRSLNGRLLPWTVGRAMDRLGMRRPILWSYAPQAEALLDRVDPELVVYHCVDDIAAHKGVDARSFRAAEERFARRADLVLASAPPLARRLRAIAGNVVDAPNVADIDFFGRARSPGPVDAAVAALARPRLVFTGAVVSTKLDMDLLVRVARTRRDWSIALVGPVGIGDPRTDVSLLHAEPNIHLLGLRPYAELPAVLRGADVGLIPYALNELTASVFPMKVYEYLAAGLPIVSTRLPSLEGIEGIAFVDDAAGFVAAVEAALADWSDAAREARSRLADGHSWDARLREIADEVQRLRARRR
jgi:glycosyltransferase involved in cell wall biosynthesis